MTRTTWIIAFSIILCAGAAYYLFRGSDGSDERDSNDIVADSSLVSVSNRPIEVLASGYASASACARCHEEQHQSWHASFHRTMTQKVKPESAPSAIENHDVVIDGMSYRFLREGDRYFVELDDPVQPGIDEVKRELVLMTGSHHMHVFWYESTLGRTLALLPIVYLLDQDRWVARNAAFVRPSSNYEAELGRWNQVCSRCHSTHPRGRHDEESSQWDTHVADFGIACEACHGPGEKHIQFHDHVAGITRGDDVVVSPADLPHELQSDVCGQCHSVQIPDFEAYDRSRYLISGMPYRPGDNLEDSLLRKVVRTTREFHGTSVFAKAHAQEDPRDTFWADGTVRVAGREYNGLIESPCFQNGTMSCLSCHEMHPDPATDLASWRDDQLKPGMRTNLACTQCHAEPQYNSEITEHTHHSGDSHGSECLNCHMPHTSYGLLKSVRSHRIESPSVMTTLTTGRPTGCALCHLDRSIRWTADHLSQWYGHQAFEFEDSLATEVSSGLVSLLRGNAGLRAVFTAGFGWEPAREASGTDWMAPYLMFGMVDEYDAVRIIAKRTLRTLPGYQNIEIDEFDDAAARAQWVTRAFSEFNRGSHLKPRPELLIDEEGRVDFGQAMEMFNARDRRPVVLRE